MADLKHLQFDKSLLVPQPYFGDPKGSYVVGSSPLEIVLLKSSTPQELSGAVWFDKGTAGPPGHVHGGCQAAVLDEMMGSTGWHHGFAVVAAKIEVDFIKMIPVHKQFALRGKITRTEGRKIYIDAEILLEDVVYARSKGLFICLTDEQKAYLAKAKDAKA